MDYNYKKLSDHSLKVLLGQHTSLRYEAQLELLQELEHRKGTPAELEELSKELERKKIYLKSLGFLDEMGYTVTTVEDTTYIKRRLDSQIIELVSIVLGVVLVFVGMYGLLNLYYLFTGDAGAGLQSLIFNGLFVFLGYKGFQMLGGLPRFINNWGMEFSFSSKQVQLRKRIDFKKETSIGNPEDVQLEQTEETLLLKFKDEIVFVANPKSFTQSATLKSMLYSIQKGEVPQQYEEATYVS